MYWVGLERVVIHINVDQHVLGGFGEGGHSYQCRPACIGWVWRGWSFYKYAFGAGTHKMISFHEEGGGQVKIIANVLFLKSYVHHSINNECSLNAYCRYAIYVAESILAEAVCLSSVQVTTESNPAICKKGGAV